jgi:hypothetical protein
MHRNIAAAARALDAIHLRTLGYSYRTIAERCGYASGGAAYNAIQREMQRTVHESAETVRTLESLKLDDMETVIAPRSLQGELKATAWRLRIMERRAKLLGLDLKPDPVIGRQPITRNYYIHCLPAVTIESGSAAAESGTSCPTCGRSRDGLIPCRSAVL